MSDFLLQYGLFLAKAATIVAAIVIVTGVFLTLSRKAKVPEKLEVSNLNRKYERLADAVRREVLPKKDFKNLVKARKKELKKKDAERQHSRQKRVFVMNFHGDIKATAVASLREEVTAILNVATPEDEVLVRLENAGGLVHEHGLAASQLMRIRERDIPLVVAVDKVAASGGYMMACVADRILAAPFAVIGSIGVLAQLPNFNRMLDRHGIEFEQIKAGEFKRTVSMFGKNSKEDRAKLKEELEDLHLLFKEFVLQNRPGVDIDAVSKGEHWPATRAHSLKLVDELSTSDDYLVQAADRANLYEVSYTAKKKLSQKLASALERSADKLWIAASARAPRTPSV